MSCSCCRCNRKPTRFQVRSWGASISSEYKYSVYWKQPGDWLWNNEYANLEKTLSDVLGFINSKANEFGAKQYTVEFKSGVGSREIRNVN